MTPCREYQGSRSEKGYGLISRKIDGRWRNVRLHRWVVEQIEGPIPEGMVVMHLCHNPPCFRYDHLQIGTPGENSRMSRHNLGPAVGGETAGEKNAQSKITAEQALDIFSSDLSVKELASIHGVSRTQVRRIKSGERWSHTTGAESSVYTGRSAGERSSP